MSKDTTSDEKGSILTECKGCQKTREHFSAMLPFNVLEKMVDKPLRIRGVAMTAGISRNFNIYTPKKLEASGSEPSQGLYKIVATSQEQTRTTVHALKLSWQSVRQHHLPQLQLHQLLQQQFRLVRQQLFLRIQEPQQALTCT
jgi:hypothetical protein